MPYITVGQENTGTIELYYEDHGRGPIVVLVHGYLLNSGSWERQLMVLLRAGYRVITYDRRGFGKSSQPAFGYEYDSLAADLDKLVTTLNLEDTALIGFSMGGGEVARYLGRYGSKHVKAAALVSALPPYLLKAPDNPEGIDKSVFEGVKSAAAADRQALVASFIDNFYNVDVFKGTRVSAAVLQSSFNIAVAASPIGTSACIDAWVTDFRGDLARIDVPVLVVHGKQDRIVPFEASGPRTHMLIPGSQFEVFEDGPHGLIWTHADDFNAILLRFLTHVFSGARASVS
jgi:non-heme chloroperoxidase